MTLLSAFNPHELPEARLRAVATGRERELETILGTVRENLTGGTMQHLIVSAPRGYGKSFLMRHIELDCARMATEGHALQAVLMPEEMPHVKEPETLLREILRVLVGGRGQEAELSWHEDDGEAWEAAMHALDVAVAERVETPGLLVALVENFDVLLKRAFAREEQRLRLRNWLTRSGTRIMLIAASASGAFDRSYDEPLFHAFRDVPLVPWSEDECLAYFDRQRIDAGKARLTALPAARARAVAGFIGGTPRLATLLGDALFDDDMLRAAELLARLTDELTPYYKERIEALPGRAQKLLDALLRFGEPASQSELARRVKAGAQSAIAGPFSELARERIVVGEKAPGSAEILYRVADRIFAHYYRRRVIDHGEGQCPLEGLVELLAQYYSKDEKLARAEHYAQMGYPAEARVMARLHDQESGIDGRSRHWMLLALATYFIPSALLPRASDKMRPLLQEIAAQAEQTNGNEASSLAEQARSDFAAGSDRIVLTMARSRLDAAAGVAGGLAAAREAVALANADHQSLLPLAMTQLAWSLQERGLPQDAVDAANRAVTMAEKSGDSRTQAAALRYAAYSLAKLGRHQETVDTATRAAALAEQAGDLLEQAMALRHAAYSLGQLGRHQEAIDTAIRAAGLAEQAGDLREQAEALRHCAFSLGQLGRHQEAIDTATRAVALAEQAGDLLEQAIALRNAAFSLRELGRHQEAIDTATRAAELAQRAGDLLEQAIALRYAAFSLGELGRHQEAVDTATRAAALAEQAGDLREQVGDLRYAALTLGQLGRYQEAAELAVQALGPAGRLDDPAVSRTVATAATIRLIHAHRFAEAFGLLADLSDAPPTPPPSVGGLAQYSGGQLSERFQDIDTTHRWLAALANAVGADALPPWAESLLRGAIDRWLNLHDADQLTAIIEALSLHLGERAAVLWHPLVAARNYHAAGRDAAALARVDPDLAQTLMTLHPPAAVQPTKRKRS